MTKTLHYLFDPLCGWCYGAGPSVSAIAVSGRLRMRLMPSGLFSGQGARPMDDGFAAYAWANDQRIERLSGQRFTEAYRRQVLANRTQPFDSGAATLALTAVAMTAPHRERETLEALQQARYVEGRDITSAESLAPWLEGLGLPDAAALLQARDTALLQANRSRVDEARTLMQAVGARGVPAFVLEQEDGSRHLLQAASAMADPHAFLEEITAAF